MAVERNRLAKFSVPCRTLLIETRSRRVNFLTRTLEYWCLFVVHGCTRLLRNQSNDGLGSSPSAAVSDKALKETLSNSIAHYAAARNVEALVSVFEFSRCWIRAKHQEAKLCRHYSRSRESTINRERDAGTFCFEHGCESLDIPHVED